MSSQIAEVLANVVADIRNHIANRLKDVKLDDFKEGQIVMSYTLTETRLFRSDVISALNKESGMLEQSHKWLLRAEKDPVIDNVINVIAMKA